MEELKKDKETLKDTIKFETSEEFVILERFEGLCPGGSYSYFYIQTSSKDLTAFIAEETDWERRKNSFTVDESEGEIISIIKNLIKKFYNK